MTKRRSVVIGLGALVLSCGLIAKDAEVKVAPIGKQKELKFGWVSQNAVAKSKEGQQLEKQVTDEHRKLAKAVEDRQKAYTDGAGAFQTKAAALSVEAREVEGEKIAKLKRDYEEAAQKAERTMQRKMQEATQEALKSFSVAAEEYAKKNGFDVLLSEAGVVYVNKEVDTTEEVSAIMNKQYEIKLAENKKAERPAAAVKTVAAPKVDAKKTEAKA